VIDVGTPSHPVARRAGVRFSPAADIHVVWNGQPQVAFYHRRNTTIARNSPTKPTQTKVREPSWLVAARAKLGTREAAGPANSPTILGWAKRLGTKVLGMIYNADSLPWCGVFVAECMDEVGIDSPLFAVRAKSWADWGANLRAERLAPGAVLVFERTGGGHVGFYVGEDVEAYHVLGGNQGDSVSVARVSKGRCVARRWPEGRPVVGKPVQVAASRGEPVSRNEA
jgi:uncharacterized protein (TIGR02594 family)